VDGHRHACPANAEKPGNDPVNCVCLAGYTGGGAFANGMYPACTLLPPGGKASVAPCAHGETRVVGGAWTCTCTAVAPGEEAFTGGGKFVYDDATQEKLGADGRGQYPACTRLEKCDMFAEVSWAGSTAMQASERAALEGIYDEMTSGTFETRVGMKQDWYGRPTSPGEPQNVTMDKAWAFGTGDWAAAGYFGSPVKNRGRATMHWNFLKCKKSYADDLCSTYRLWGTLCWGGHVVEIDADKLKAADVLGAIDAPWKLSTKVNGLTKLRKLELSATGLVALPDTVASLTGVLHMIFMENAGLKKLPCSVWKLPKLHMIDVDNTGLEELAIGCTGANNPDLEFLFANRCNLRQVGIGATSSPKLKLLSISNTARQTGKTKNKISKFELDPKGGLEVLDMSASLDVTGNSKLSDFITIANSPLQVLDVQNNNLRGDVSSAFDGAPKLRQVNLANNKLTGALPSFTNTPKLESFDASHNTFTSWPPYPKWKDQGRAGGFDMLTTLKLAHNNLTHNDENVKEGHIEQQLTYLPAVKNLDLSHNKLTTRYSLPNGFNFLTKSFPPNIETLDLSHNALDRVFCATGAGAATRCGGAQNKYPKLHTLKLNNNKNFGGDLPEYMFGDGTLAALKKLDLSGCKFSGAIPVISKPTMEELDATNNPGLKLATIDRANPMALPFGYTTGGAAGVLAGTSDENVRCPSFTHRDATLRVDPSYYGYVGCKCARGLWGNPAAKPYDITKSSGCFDFNAEYHKKGTNAKDTLSDTYNEASTEHVRLSSGLSTTFSVKPDPYACNATNGPSTCSFKAIKLSVNAAKMATGETLLVKYKDSEDVEHTAIRADCRTEVVTDIPTNTTKDVTRCDPVDCLITAGSTHTCFALTDTAHAVFTSSSRDNAVSFIIEYEGLKACDKINDGLNDTVATSISGKCMPKRASLESSLTLQGMEEFEHDSPSAKRTAVIEALAKRLGVHKSAIVITDVTVIPIARRRLNTQGGTTLKISYRVAASSSSQAVAVQERAQATDFKQKFAEDVKAESGDTVTVTNVPEAFALDGVCGKGTQLFTNAATPTDEQKNWDHSPCFQDKKGETTAGWYRKVKLESGKQGCCVPCPLGTYKSSDDTRLQCLPCHPDRFADEPGETQSGCKSCNPSGQKTATNTAARSGCKCLSGHFATVNQALPFKGERGTSYEQGIDCIKCHESASCLTESEAAQVQSARNATSMPAYEGLTFESVQSKYSYWTLKSFYRYNYTDGNAKQHPSKLKGMKCKSRVSGRSWCTGGNYTLGFQKDGLKAVDYIASSGANAPRSAASASCPADTDILDMTGKQRVYAEGCGCAIGHMGPLCAVCMPGFRKGLRSNGCDKCDQDANKKVTYSLVGFFAALLLFVGIFFQKVRECAQESKEKLNQIRKRSQAHLSEAFSGQDLVDFESGFMNFMMGGGDSFLSFKILIGLFQVLPQFDFVFSGSGFQWPSGVRELFGLLAIFNLNFTQFASLGCLVETNFVDDFLVTTMLPLILTAIVVVLHLAAKKAGKTWFRKRNNLIRATLAIFFVAYPGASSSSLRMLRYNCKTMPNGDQYLQADMWIRCNDDSQKIRTWFGDDSSYKAYESLAWFFVAVYPFGVPICLFAMLYRNRKNLYEKDENGVIKRKYDEDTKRLKGWKTDRKLGKSLGLLYSSYKPKYWWWEVFELIRKVLITGMLIFVMPGTPSQFAFGILLSLFFMLFYTGCRPYCDKVNSWLQMICQVAVFMMLFAGLLIAAQISDEDGYDMDALEGMMVFITVLPIAIGGVMIIYTNVALFCGDVMVLCKKKKASPGGAEQKEAVVTMNDVEAELDGVATAGKEVAVSETRTTGEA
jgi:Leucine-rich repeat (LRR) protein